MSKPSSTDVFAWRRMIRRPMADAWLERTAFAGRGNAVIRELPGGSSARLEIYVTSRPLASKLKKSFGGEVRKISTASWLKPADKGFVLPVDDRLVVASDRKAIPEKHKKLPVLVIPAGMAFGTGDHATTAMCLRRLLRHLGTNGRGKVHWDLGTGSGILALAGAWCGAKVQGMDFDPDSIREARKNAVGNPQVPKVHWQQADVLKWKPVGKADVITANLFADLLTKALPRVKGWLKPGGTLILSGVLKEQEKMVLGVLAKCGFRLKERARKGKWVCLIAVK